MKPLILIDEAEADVSDAYGFYLPRREGPQIDFLLPFERHWSAFRRIQVHFRA